MGDGRPDTGHRLQYRALGAVGAVRDGTDVGLGGPRQRRLLAALLLHANRRAPVDEVAEVVFAGAPGRNAEATLRTYVSRLRRALADDGDDGSPVASVPGGWVLDVPDDCFDVRRLEADVARARRCLAHGEPAEAARTLRDALARWGGRPYGDLGDEQWFVGEAQRLVELRRTGLEALMDAELARGRAGEVVGELEALVEEFPLAESFRGQLMTALYRSGRQVEALRAYQRFRTTLVDELGLEPSEALARLERRILDRDPALDPDDDGIVLRGYRLEHRLGRGDDGVVWSATQPGEQRDLAIRVYDAERADATEFIATFEEQARRLASLDVDSVVTIRDWWREPGAAYLVMDRLPGTTLEDRLREAPLDQATTARVVIAAGEALTAAEHVDVAHGRLHAGSIRFDADDHPVVTDFRLGVRNGQAHSRDVAGLARLVVHCLTGRRRVDATSTADLPDAARELVVVGLDPTTSETIAPDDYAGALHAALTGATSHGHRRRPNPYKGLAVFDEADAEVFFGRERLVATLVERLERGDATGHLTLVVGPSGSGKSSVVRAGLIPALRAQATRSGTPWLVAGMVPGGTPYKALGEALHHVAVDAPETLVEDLARDEAGIATVVERILPDDTEAVLVIDQFEELFTLTHRHEQQRFLDALAHLAERPDTRMRVVATLRADFYDRPLSHPRLGPLIQSATVTVPAMSAAELESAVTRPAERAGLVVEEGLVAELVTAAIDEPAALPALQFALYELAEGATDSELRVEAYERLGGVHGAIAARAEHLYLALDDDDRAAVRGMFEQLVTWSHAEPTRRRAAMDELHAVGGAELVATWVDARLLTSSRDPETRTPTIEVAHEALVAHWPRLHDWLVEDRDSLETVAGLREATRTWADQDHDPDLLYRGNRLEHALEVVGARPGAVTEPERRFLAAAGDARDRTERERAEQGARQARANRRLKRLLTATGLLLVVALLAALVAVDRQRRADDAAADAEANAVAADSARMVATAENLADENQRVALLLAAEAHRRDPSPATLGALQTALTARTGFLGFVGLDDTARGRNVAFGPAGEVVVRTPEEVEVYDGETLELRHRFEHQSLTTEGNPTRKDLAVAPERRMLATRDLRSATALDLDTGEELFTVEPGGYVLGVWFAPTGELLVSTGQISPPAADVFVYAPDGQLLGSFAKGSGVGDLDFSPDGRTLVAAVHDADVGLRIFEWPGLTELPAPEREVFGYGGLFSAERTVAFSSDGGLLAAGFVDGHVVVWDTGTWQIARFDRSGEPMVLYDPQATFLLDIEILGGRPTDSSQSTQVVALGVQRISRWDLREGRQGAERDPSVPTQSAPTRHARNLDLDRAGGRLAVGVRDVELWSTDDSGLLAEAIGGPGLGPVAAAGVHVFRQDTSATRVGPLWRRDLVTGEDVLVHPSVLWGATTSPDGRLVVFEEPIGEVGQATDLRDIDESWLHVLDSDTLEAVQPPLRVPCCVQARDFSDDGSLLAVGYGVRFANPPNHIHPTDGTVDVFEVSPQGLRPRLRIEAFAPLLGEADQPFYNVELSPDGRRVITDGDSILAEWDTDDGALLRDTEAIRASLTGYPLGRDRSSGTYVWLPATQVLQPVDQHTLEPVGAPYLDTRSFEVGAPLALFSPDARLAFFATMGGVTMWDVASRQRMGEQFPNSSYPDTFVSHGIDPILLPADSPLGGRLVTTTPNQLLAWDLDLTTWSDVACRAVGRNLSLEEWQRFGPDAPYRATCDEWPSGAKS